MVLWGKTIPDHDLISYCQKIGLSAKIDRVRGPLFLLVDDHPRRPNRRGTVCAFRKGYESMDLISGVGLWMEKNISQSIDYRN